MIPVAGPLPSICCDYIFEAHKQGLSALDKSINIRASETDFSILKNYTDAEMEQYISAFSSTLIDTPMNDINRAIENLGIFTPLLFSHGMLDDRVPLRDSER